MVVQAVRKMRARGVFIANTGGAKNADGTACRLEVNVSGAINVAGATCPLIVGGAINVAGAT